MSYTGATPAFKCLFFLARDQGLKMTTKRTQITARKCTKLRHLFQNFHGEASPELTKQSFGTQVCTFDAKASMYTVA